MGQEVGWTFSGDKEKEQGWTFSKPGWSFSQPPPQPGMGKIRPKTESILKTAKDVAIGIPESVVSGVSGMAGMMGGLAGQAATGLYNIWKSGGRTMDNPLRPFGEPNAVKAKEKVSGLMAHEPTTRFAQSAIEVASSPFTAVLDGVDWAAKKATDDPELQQGIRFVAELALVKGIKPATGYIKRVIAAKKPLRIETMIKFIEENAPPEVIDQMKKGLSDKYFPKETQKAGPISPKITVKTTATEPAKTMAEQGAGLVGEPRGGSLLPTMELPKRVGPINLERLDLGESAQKLVADMEDRLTMSRVKSGRKNVPWSESEKASEIYGGAYEIGQVLGKTAEDLLSEWGKSTKNLDSKVEATRTLFKTAFSEAQKAAREAMDNLSPAAEAKAQMAYNRWALVQYSIGQGSGEIGRALNIHKKLARSKEMILTKSYARMLKELGHDKLTPEAMELLASFDETNPIAGMKFLANARKATTKEKLFEVWINSLLANPSTHIVNFTSNMLFEAMAPGERLLGAGVEFIKHPLKANKRELFFGEAAHSIVGAFHGMKEGLNRYAYTMTHGITKSGISKFEETGIAPRKAIKGVKGEVVRFPGTELMSNDEMWKAIIYTDDLYAQAYRATTKEGLRGDVRKAKMAELIANPPEAMTEAANRAARVRTFQAELGKLGNDFMRMRSRPGVAGAALNFIFPFVRTPINIVKEGLKRTPLGIAGAKDLVGAEHSMAIGREVAALSTAILVAYLVSEGKITGAAPENRAEREALYNTGWRPYSLKIGDTYHGYGRIEPIATQIGIMADAYPVVKNMNAGEWTRVAAKIGTAFRNNVSNKTFLTGMNDVINATTDPARYGELLLKRWATSLVPGGGLLGGVARAVDPEIKDARKVIDWYKSRIPFLSKEVPPKLNVMGQPQKTGGSVLSRLLSPVSVSKEANDPVYTELERQGINLAPMQPLVDGKKMSPAQSRKLSEEAGPEIKKAVSGLISSPLYKKQTNENKKKMLKSWITKTRAYQKGLFIMRSQ